MTNAQLREDIVRMLTDREPGTLVPMPTVEHVRYLYDRVVMLHERVRAFESVADPDQPIDGVIQ